MGSQFLLWTHPNGHSTLQSLSTSSYSSKLSPKIPQCTLLLQTSHSSTVLRNLKRNHGTRKRRGFFTGIRNQVPTVRRSHCDSKNDLIGDKTFKSRKIFFGLPNWLETEGKLWLYSEFFWGWEIGLDKSLRELKKGHFREPFLLRTTVERKVKLTTGQWTLRVFLPKWVLEDLNFHVF